MSTDNEIDTGVVAGILMIQENSTYSSSIWYFCPNSITLIAGDTGGIISATDFNAPIVLFHRDAVTLRVAKSTGLVVHCTIINKD